MSVEELKRFSEAVKKDKAMQEELKKVGKDEAAVVAFAKGKGYDFTADELKAQAKAAKGELSEDQLDKVAGGVDTTVVVVAVAIVAT